MSCKKFMNNYLYQSTTNGGTVDDDYNTVELHNFGYWTMSSLLSRGDSIAIDYFGRISKYNTSNLYFGARAVVEVYKKL